MYQIKIYKGHPDQSGVLREVITPEQALELYDSALDPKKVRRQESTCLHCGVDYMAPKSVKTPMYCSNCSTPKKRRSGNAG